MARRKSILVVDDYTAMRQALKSGLESVGFKDITMSANGRDAWRLLSKQRFDLVVSDLNMPEMNGLQLLERVRTDEKLRHLPFILVTAEREKDLITSAIDLGVTDCLIKPYRPAYFIEKMKKALQAQTINIRPPTNNPVAIDQPNETVTEAAQLSPDTSSSAISEHKETVLVVDDIQDNIAIISNLIKPHYKVKIAKSGVKALEIAQSGDIDLILLDIMMPEMDGYEVCQRLKADEQTEDIPVIFLSGKDGVENITEGFRLGAVDYITKPIEADILMARVHTHMALRRSRLDLIKQVDTLIEHARLKDDVERIMQHDLTNPLAAVSAELKAIIQSPNISPRAKERFRLMQISVGQALKTVTGSLDLFKIEKGKFVFKPQRVDVSESVNQVIRDLHDVAESKNIIIDKRDKLQQSFASGDGVLCYSIFSNLLKNAIEASPSYDMVIITIELRENFIFVHFENSGVIDSSIRHKLFEKYVTANKRNGTGLGTYSAQLMAIVQGGELNFETINEEKTRFTVRLNRFEQGN